MASVTPRPPALPTSRLVVAMPSSGPAARRSSRRSGDRVGGRDCRTGTVPDEHAAALSVPPAPGGLRLDHLADRMRRPGPARRLPASPDPQHPAQSSRGPPSRYHLPAAVRQTGQDHAPIRRAAHAHRRGRLACRGRQLAGQPGTSPALRRARALSDAGPATRRRQRRHERRRGLNLRADSPMMG